MKPQEFRKKIISLGLTQRETAEICGVTTNAVEKWLSGKRKIPVYAQILINKSEKLNKKKKGK